MFHERVLTSHPTLIFVSSIALSLFHIHTKSDAHKQAVAKPINRTCKSMLLEQVWFLPVTSR